MATGFEWIEMGLKYSKSVAALFLFLISLSGYNIYGNFDKSSTIEKKEKELTATQEQVANVAKHFYITTEPKKIKPADPVVQCTAACLTIINKAIEKGLAKHKKGRLH